MEQARVLIAIVLSFLVFFLWNFFFVEKQAPETQTAETAVQKTEQKTLAQTEAPANKVVEEKSPEPYVAETSVASQKTLPRMITVESPLYSVAINESGAVFQSYVLKSYKESMDPGAADKELIDPAASRHMLKLSLAGKSIPGLEEAIFTAQQAPDRLLVVDGEKELVFSWRSDTGVLVEKRYRFDPDSYLIQLSIDIKNGSERSIIDKVVLGIEEDSATEKGGYSFEGPCALIDGKLEQIKQKKIKDKNEYSGNIKWLAIVDRYFMKSLIPLDATSGVMKLSLDGDGILGSRFIGQENTIQPGTQKRFAYQIFFGPKSMQVLKDIGHDLSKAIHFGMFDIIAKPLLWFMNFIYSRIPNYGIAIIVLTILTKILLWPLGSKSYKSMNEMKRLQPLMAEIREKYKDDKKMMNQEIMSLYRTYKINPMGGCLPMILQIPVFFALYRMLYQAIELRHAPFFLWINDLSAPDRLFHFSFSIPFMQPPYGIPVLTVIMGATMLLQQKMSPPPGDPTQAKMMMLMPIVFTVIFINFSSGLVLYWLINNILSIAQQTYIQKKYA
ncbi:MAG: membrane protein insertase YidC [Deltaproteobacteria bacterium]|jgi:YidC/Oxa1 family membrane protein insertase|nr:membrane protein insertase YidC [Deltaproteobacteria bacterium]